jgi:hypothetical protein
LLGRGDGEHNREPPDRSDGEYGNRRRKRVFCCMISVSCLPPTVSGRDCARGRATSSSANPQQILSKSARDLTFGSRDFERAGRQRVTPVAIPRLGTAAHTHTRTHDAGKTRSHTSPTTFSLTSRFPCCIDFFLPLPLLLLP